MVSSVHADDSLAAEHGSAYDRWISLPLSEDEEQIDSPGELHAPREKAANRETSVSPAEDAAPENGTTFPARFTEHCDEWHMVHSN